MNLLKRLWEFDLIHWRSVPIVSQVVFVLLLISGLVFILGQIALGGNPLNNGFTLPDFIDVVKKDVMVTDVPDAMSIVYPYIWLGLASFYFISALLVYVLGYFASRKMIGDQMFNRYFITYNLTFIIGSVLVLGISGLLKGMGLNVNIAVEYVAESTNIIKNAFGAYIPTIFQVKSYWLAVLASITFATFPSYVAHRLCHESRFFWHVCHRGHHAPKFLHPMAAPPAFVLDFFLIIPTGIVGLMISKLIYAEPLVMEMALWFTCALALGPLAHCSALYDKAYNNRVVRFFSLLYGDGLYHMMHHSARPGDEAINMAGGPFMIWDRVFGSYKSLYPQCPEVGLTNAPDVHMNPLRVIFAGVAQMAYEWKMNKDWRIRFKIIFGSIWYKPPVTKDYLVISKQ